MRRNSFLTVVSALALLVACSQASQENGGGPPGDQPPSERPAANLVLEANADFEFAYMPEVPVTALEWDVEIDYAVRDVQGVFDHYDAALAGLGFTRTSLETDNDEIEARYSREGVTIELEVELDDGRTQVDFDLDDLNAGTAPATFTLREFGGIEIPFYDAEIVEVEWDFGFHHATTDHQSVFEYYDAALRDLGWARTDLETEGDEIEADYAREGVRLDLEVDREGNHVDVELEFNKLRFYQGGA